MNMAARRWPMLNDSLPPLPPLLPLADRDILSLLPTGCALFDRNGHCTYVNSEGQLLIGQQIICPEQTIFFHVTTDIPKPYLRQQLPFIKASQGKSVTASQVMFFRQGKPIVLEMTAAPLFSSESSSDGSILLFHEVSFSPSEATTDDRKDDFYRRLAENMPGAFQYRMLPNGHGSLTYVSPRFYEIYGIEASWLLENPNNLWNITSPDTVQAMQAEVSRSYATLTPWVHQGILITPKGEQHFQGYATPEKIPNGDVVWHGFIFDITEQKKAEIAQRSSEQQLRSVSSTILGVPFRYELDSDGHYGFTELDEQIQKVYGIDRKVLLDHPDTLENMAHHEDRHALKNAITQILANPESFNLEYRIITPQGQIKWTKIIAQHEQQVDNRHVWYGMILDITERKQVDTILADYNESLEREVYQRTLELEMEVQERKRAEDKARRAEVALRQANAKLELLATLDGLTQIANRRRFDEFLNQTWRLMMRQKQTMSVIMLDVDYFKRYNDTYGHQAGDACLQKIAKVLQTAVNRAGDLVTRYGGEEFAIVLGDTDELGARSLCYNIRWAIAELNLPHSASDVSSHVTVSIGICTMVPSLQILPESLVAMADKALYAAKHQGRNRAVHSFDVV